MFIRRISDVELAKNLKKIMKITKSPTHKNISIFRYLSCPLDIVLNYDN